MNPERDRARLLVAGLRTVDRLFTPRRSPFRNIADADYRAQLEQDREEAEDFARQVRLDHTAPRIDLS